LDLLTIYSGPGILKIEVVTGDSEPFAGTADAAMRKRDAAGSALDEMRFACSSNCGPTKEWTMSHRQCGR
jgi:hypothetical protein